LELYLKPVLCLVLSNKRRAGSEERPVLISPISWLRYLYRWGPSNHVSLSSTESEYTTVSKVGCEVMWRRYLLAPHSGRQRLRNSSGNNLLYHWIRDHVERGDIAVSHVSGNENPADIFTKTHLAGSTSQNSALWLGLQSKVNCFVSCLCPLCAVFCSRFYSPISSPIRFPYLSFILSLLQ